MKTLYSFLSTNEQFAFVKGADIRNVYVKDLTLEEFHQIEINLGKKLSREIKFIVTNYLKFL
jgi:hypothetical protein